MLQIVIPSTELYDSRNNLFINTKEQAITLEHSLVSISKWESKWNKPFLSKDKKTKEEIIYYVKCMTITQNVDDSVYSYLTNKNIEDINSYIEAPMTATKFSEKGNTKHSNEIITSELIYYWMVAYNIPLECQKWHLNRLMTLIRICSIKNAPSKKMSKAETLKHNAKLNAERCKRLHTRG